ncbi:NADH:ubiquinone reductase (Na(+)-transporting) subunit B [Candidatus Marinamargulisbacteria bacterium SCGC AAA071-K20]|nr:NADH:ubiquinone reductase (Na(+)-transporting) subunit B [Candidatus Marinamargulisbacteria bacterium SCGC AAA071-K20]
MNPLRALFDKLEKPFHKGAPLEKYYPLFEAMESFLFSTRLVTKSKVHVRDNLGTKRFMSMVLFALTPCALFGIYNTGYQSHLASGLSLDLVSVVLTGAQIVLPIVIVSYAVGLFWEFLFCVIRGHEVNEGFLVTGLLYPLILPPTIPLWQVAVGITFGVIVGKEVFGGTGRNFLNPALTARAFLFFTYPASISGEVWTAIITSKDKIVDGFSGATALAIAAATEAPNNAQLAMESAGYNLNDLFIGFVPGSIGETSAALAIVGGLFLIITGVGSWRTMLGGFLGAVSMSLLFNYFATSSTLPFFQLDLLWQLSMGGFAFGIVFMATDPVSSPALESSRFIYGFLIGMLGMIIRVINPAYPEGWMLAILLMNVFAPLIDYVVLQKRKKKRIRNVI